MLFLTILIVSIENNLKGIVMSEGSFLRVKRIDKQALSRHDRKNTILDVAIQASAKRHYMLVTKAEIGAVCEWASATLAYYFGMMDDFRVSVVERALHNYRETKDQDAMVVLAQAIVLRSPVVEALTKEERYEILGDYL